MSNNQNFIDTYLISTAVRAAMCAGSEIMDVYCQQSFDVEYKSDKSPLTKADIRANAVIMAVLRETDLPILSEEGEHLPYEERQAWKRFWLIDPLDGTSEFVAKSGDFCVNVALIDNSEPILGVIYSPVKDIVWFGAMGFGAYKIEDATKVIDDFSFDTFMNVAIKLPYRNTGDEFVFVTSRSNLNASTKKFIDTLSTEYTKTRIVHVGSALKFTVLADGMADLYPRFATTSEWDTGAGHAILRSMGGNVFQEDTNVPLVYNKANLDNPGFVAFLKMK
jgi:3'(2'), 5'-bisphosphate nucleotidase